MNSENESGASNKDTSNFSHTVHNILQRCINSNGEPIRINVISELENCEKRRLYDLFNVLCALGLCIKSTDKMYIWRGRENMIQTITNEYENCEIQSLSVDIWSYLHMPESPPIGRLAITMILIFLYFGEKEMSLKQLCMIMAQKRSKMNRLLRRLYLAAFFLEQVDVIAHSCQIGSYEIVLDINEISKNAFNDRRLASSFPATSIFSQLKVIRSSLINELKQGRKEALYAKMKQCHIPATTSQQLHNKSGKNSVVEQMKIVPNKSSGSGCNIALLNIGQPILIESY